MPGPRQLPLQESHRFSGDNSPRSSTADVMESPPASSWKKKSKTLFTVYSPHQFEGKTVATDGKLKRNNPPSSTKKDSPHSSKTFTEYPGENVRHGNSAPTTRSSTTWNPPKSSSTCETKPEHQQSSPKQDNGCTEKLKHAEKCIADSYRLVWGKDMPECQEALSLLQQAVKTQISCLGKHHPDVGFTVNFIGTTHWRMSQVVDPSRMEQHCKSAVKYFLEARRIFGKSPNCKASIADVDKRMECILNAQLHWTPPQVSQFMAFLRQMMEHEQQGDNAKAKSDLGTANNEYRKARQLGNILKRQIN